MRNLHSLIEESGAVITRQGLPSITGDPVQMTRLFQNLLVNSIKYRSPRAAAHSRRRRQERKRLAVFGARQRNRHRAAVCGEGFRHFQMLSSRGTNAPGAAWAWPFAGRLSAATRAASGSNPRSAKARRSISPYRATLESPGLSRSRYFHESIAFRGRESGRKSSSSRRTPLGSIAFVMLVFVDPVRGSSTLTPRAAELPWLHSGPPARTRCG